MTAPATLLVFVSMFAAGDKGGVRAFHFDTATGALTPARETHGLSNVFFMAVAPDRKTLYAVHAEKFGSPADEEVTAWRIAGRDGTLEPLGRQSSKGNATCYLDVAPSGRALLLANYSGGSVASLPIGADGTVGPAASFVKHAGSSVDDKRQKEPHPHAFVHSPDGRFAFAPDLGTDRIHAYRLDAAAGAVTAHEAGDGRAPAGAGPRHATFHPDGRRLYAINELSNSVTVYEYDAAAGTLAAGATVSTLPEDFKGTTYCADVKISPDGRFLYGTNRGHDSIAVFRIAADGRLERIEIVPSRGKGPQNLAITPDGKFLLCANMPGGNLALFHIDAGTGRLTAVGEPMAVTSPACIAIIP